MTAKAQLESLQAGRALAALAVVVHHANLAARSFGGRSFDILDMGYLGVDFFFVLSGFIIAHSAPGKSLANYSWHRFRRVYLPYWPIGIGMALLYLALPDVSGGEREWSWLATLTLLPVNKDPALSVAWTLQHEVLFYAIFALAWFSKRLWLVMGLWVAAIVAARIADIDWRVFGLINLEFLFGMAAHAAFKRNIGTKWLYMGAALAVAAWIALGAEREFSVLIGLACALSIPPLLASERRGMRVPPLLSRMGDASYSIYLAHGLAISIFVRFGPPAILLTCFLAGVAGGLVYYWIVERQILRLAPRDIKRLTK